MTDGMLPTTRRADMDYLRVGALLLLIIYHTLCVYDSAEWWRVQSSHAGPWADFIISLFAPWRMPLVFFVGGVAARFMLDKMSWGAFIGDRAAKLLTAFAFAIVVLVPPQNYVRLDDNGQVTPGYLEYLITQAPFALRQHGVPIPDPAHAWFLPYLFVYSVAAAFAVRFAPRVFTAVQTRVQGLSIAAIAAMLVALLAFDDAVMAPWRPETRLLIPDITAHLRYAPVFFLGLLVAKSASFQARLLRALKPLCIAAAALGLAFLGAHAAHALQLNEPQMLAAIAAIVRGAFAGVAILAVTALASALLTKPTPLLGYATDAILPIYLIHQTTLVAAADALVPLGWPLAAELPLLFVASFLAPLALYHVLIRPFLPMRILFGLRPHARTSLQAPA